MEILTSSPHVLLQDTDFSVSMYVHGYFPCMYTFTQQASLVLLGAEEATRSLELKSQTAMSCHLGARKQTPTSKRTGLLCLLGQAGDSDSGCSLFQKLSSARQPWLSSSKKKQKRVCRQRANLNVHFLQTVTFTESGAHQAGYLAGQGLLSPSITKITSTHHQNISAKG